MEKWSIRPKVFFSTEFDVIAIDDEESSRKKKIPKKRYCQNIPDAGEVFKPERKVNSKAYWKPEIAE